MVPNESLAHNEAGVQRYHQGNLDGALEMFRQALKDPGTDVASCFNNIGRVLHDKGDSETALRYYEKAIQASSSPELHASCYNNIGCILKENGDLFGAWDRFQEALAIEILHSPDSRGSPEVYSNMGQVKQEQGELDEALALYKLSIRDDSWDPLHVAAAQNNIGSLLQTKGDLDGAMQRYNSALGIREDIAPSSLAVAATYSSMGSVLHRMGEYSQSLDYFQRSLVIREAVAPGSLIVASTLNSLGALWHEQGNLDEAGMNYRRAMEIREREAPNSLSEASSCNNIGRLLLEQENDWACAIYYLKRSLAIRQSHCPDSLVVAQTYCNLAIAFHDQEDLDVATNFYQQAINIEDRLAPDSILTAISCVNISGPLVDLNRLTEARAFLEKCRAILQRQSIDPKHIANLFCLYQLGKIELKQGRPRETLTYANAVLDLSADFRWAYTLKASALEKLLEIDQALKVLDYSLHAVPHFADAALARLRLIVQLSSVDFQYEELLLPAVDHTQMLKLEHRPNKSWCNQDGTVRATGGSASCTSRAVRLPQDVVCDHETLQETLKEIKTDMSLVVSQLAKLKSDTGAILSTQHKQISLILEMRSGQEKAQAFLNYLIAGETVPCPRVALFVPIRKTICGWKRTLDPFRCLWHVYFPCERTFRIANPHDPMTVSLSRPWLNQVAPLIKASLVAINIACRVAGIALPPLPFPELGFVGNVRKFDDIFKSSLHQDVFNLLSLLDLWSESMTEQSVLHDNRLVAEMKTLTEESYRSFSELALHQRGCWDPFLRRVADENGKIIWVAVNDNEV